MLLFILIILFNIGIDEKPLPSFRQGFYQSKEAFLIHHAGSPGINTVKVIYDSDNTPNAYVANLNMPVCEDTLCRNVILKAYWDLAGNYTHFDTIPGHPLIKFDHLLFSDEDYSKLDEILKDKNSPLRLLEKKDLIDPDIVLKSNVVDAVTGATPLTIQNAVVKGAVYSSYELWHFVNIQAKNQIRKHTGGIYSKKVESKMLSSDNYNTQLYALGQMTSEDLQSSWGLIRQVLMKSVPLVCVNILNRIPLPLKIVEDNMELSALFFKLDGYSQSILLKRVTSEKQIAEVFLPMLLGQADIMDSRHMKICLDACAKYKIHF